MNLTVHQRTPSLGVIDGRGLPIRQVEYLRKVAGGPVETLITRQLYDVAGRLIEQWDPRLFEHAPKPNLATVHGLSGHPVKVDSVDSGWRLSLAGLGGEILQRWDERGNRWQTTYDDLLRALTVDENTQQVEVFTYARGDADPGYNLRGQLRKKVDPAGSIEFSRFSLQSMPFEETRTFPEGKVYTTAWSYIASGQPVSQTDASGHQQRSRYDVTGQLKHVTLQIKADDTVLDILKDAQYNADGQLVEQLAGNDVLSTWTYDPADGRLQNLQAGVPGQAPRQHLRYLYDRVGNLLRIDDPTFQPVFFANQRIDGHREFTYDSLYRVISATGHDATPPSDLPGRPLPSDPRNHLNYTQRYEYDTGGNLIKLIHGRAVGGYTRQLFIDPESNRGVRWKEGDPAPDFSALFDRHGNLQALHPGQDLRWNNRDQLASVTLVERDDAANDEETYRYSHGARVYKRHDTHTAATSHFHEVIYLPGLEIRKRDNGEELHVITAPGGRGSVRCLHWVSGRPDEIEADQLRYSLDDHLGSSVMELDQQARLISHEGYYPFGGTAWLTADSALEVSYKTVRYSGKEMDVSGLYYYGLRYYAPWLQRWVSADPAGDVDGLNLYAMVSNSPISFVDRLGLAGDPVQEIRNTSNSMISSNALHAFEAPRNVPKKQTTALEAQHKAQHPYYNYTKSKKAKLIVNAGGSLSDADPEQTFFMNAHHNIPHPSGISSTPGLTLVDSKSNAEFRTYKVSDIGKFKTHLEAKYESYYNSDESTVLTYKGSSQTPIDFQTVRREKNAVLLSDDVWEATLDHLNKNNFLLPEPDGIPGAHGEVLVKNTASLLKTSEQKEIVKIWTFKITTPATEAFAACTNCTGILRSAQGNISAEVQTGYNDEKLSTWRGTHTF